MIFQKFKEAHEYYKYLGTHTMLDNIFDIKRNCENKSDIEFSACFRKSCIHFNY